MGWSGKVHSDVPEVYFKMFKRAILGCKHKIFLVLMFLYLDVSGVIRSECGRVK